VFCTLEDFTKHEHYDNVNYHRVAVEIMLALLKFASKICSAYSVKVKVLLKSAQPCTNIFQLFLPDWILNFGD